MDYAHVDRISTCCALDFSPIKGPEGNIEYLIHLQKSENEAGKISADLILKMCQTEHLRHWQDSACMQAVVKTRGQNGLLLYYHK